MKKRYLQIGIGLGSVICAISIGIQAYSSVKPIRIKKEEEKASYSESITLMASQNWIKAIDRELFKKFQEETGIQVKVMVTPDNGYETLLSTSLAGGSDAVDIFMYQVGAPMIFAGIPEIAEEIGDQPWVERLEEWAYQGTSVEGKLYGFSTWGIDYEGVLYNRSYFEENHLQVPNTWDGFIKLCDEILQLGKVPLYEPINGIWHTQGLIYAITPILRKENPNFIEQINSSARYRLYDSEQFKKGMSQISELLRPSKKLQKNYFLNDGQVEDWFGSYDSLKNRESVMMFTYSAYATELIERGSEDEWGMFPFPICDNQTAVSNGGGIAKFINKKSENKEECKSLFNFLAEEEHLEAYYSSRPDLIDTSFENVKSVQENSATLEILSRSIEEIPILLLKEILYWDPNIYQYLQEVAMGKLEGEEIIEKMDEYRMRMFETTGY